MLAARSRTVALCVFLLPDSAESYLLDVTSVPRGATLFSPQLVLLNAGGSIERQVPRESFLFHGETLRAAVRARPQERYLVVASDAASVGRPAWRFGASTQSFAVPLGAGFFTVHGGSEQTSELMHAHNGRIVVHAAPLPDRAEIVR